MRAAADGDVGGAADGHFTGAAGGGAEQQGVGVKRPAGDRRHAGAGSAGKCPRVARAEDAEAAAAGGLGECAGVAGGDAELDERGGDGAALVVQLAVAEIAADDCEPLTTGSMLSAELVSVVTCSRCRGDDDIVQIESAGGDVAGGSQFGITAVGVARGLPSCDVERCGGCRHVGDDASPWLEPLVVVPVLAKARLPLMVVVAPEEVHRRVGRLAG